MKRYIIFCLFLFLLVGCSTNSKKEDGIVSDVEAKEMIINDQAILVDVRESQEFNNNHIEGAINLPLDSIDNVNASKAFESKDNVIIVYCQSGNRSHQALEKLESLGYSNVYDLGSMNNWK